MTPRKRDPLLTAARLLLMAMIAVLGFATVLVALAIPFIIVFQDRVMAEIAKEGITAGPEFIGAVALLLAGVAGLLGVAVYGLILLRRIVMSVGEGDPFVPANADRLARMGWLALAAQLASIPIGAMAMWIAEIVQDSDKVEIGDDFGFDIGGILLILILFILARVFRQGAKMREELEGTV